MSDEVQIQQVLNQYTEAAGRADWQAVVDTFLPDGVWEVPGMDAKLDGHDAIREGQASFAAPFDYIVQLNAPAVIEIEGDVAVARSVIREVGKFAGQDEALEVLGFYHDTLSRSQNGWKFSRRVFEIRGMHKLPLLPSQQA